MFLRASKQKYSSKVLIWAITWAFMSSNQSIPDTRKTGGAVGWIGKVKLAALRFSWKAHGLDFLEFPDPPTLLFQVKIVHFEKLIELQSLNSSRLFAGRCSLRLGSALELNEVRHAVHEKYVCLHFHSSEATPLPIC